MSVSDSFSDTTDQEPTETNWDDWEEEEESEGLKSLFGDARFASLEEVLAHDQQQRGFNLRQYRKQHGLDQVGTIRLINFIRASVAAGTDPLPALQGGGQPWLDDRYLQPVLMDDELMFHDWEEEDEEDEEQGEGPAAAAITAGSGPVAAAAAGGAAGAGAGAAGDGSEVRQLQQENEALRGMLEAMRAVVLQDEGMRELVAEQQQQAAAGPAAGEASSSRGAGAAVAAVATASAAAPAPADEAAKRIDDSYFDSYSTFDIHRDMLGDKVRTEAYRDALEKNPALIKGATVLDVGCGTGILSMFAARGGASTVIGIDGSEQIAKFARANVLANGLAAEQGGPITIVSSKVEELQSLPLPAQQDGQPPAAQGHEQQQGQQQGQQQQQQQQQVDVLVSEWMGYALLFESMLDSVLVARDRWLRPGGAVLPDLANLYVAAAGEGATGLDFWKDVYGFSMEAVRSSLKADGLKRAMVRAVAPHQLISEAVEVQRFDLATMRAEDQDFTAPFRLTVGAGPQKCHALVLWFDTLFSDRFCREHPVELSTSPCGPQTHWVQTVLLLKEPMLMAPAVVAAEGVAVALQGQISMCRSRQTHRSLDIVLRYAAQYADGSAGEEQVVLYGMGVES